MCIDQQFKGEESKQGRAMLIGLNSGKFQGAFPQPLSSGRKKEFASSLGVLEKEVYGVHAFVLLLYVYLPLEN